MSSEELGPRDGYAVAESSRKARPGEIVMVDAGGRELGKLGTRRLERTVAAMFATVGAIIGLALYGPLGAVVGGVAGLIAIRSGKRSVQPYLAAHSQLLRGDLDGAEAAIHALSPPTRGPRAILAASTLGWVAFGRGDLPRAEQLFERVIELSGRNHVLRLQVQSGLADVVARRGDLGRARAVRDAMVVPEGSSPIFEISRLALDLTFAILEHTEAALDEDVLDRCERLALELEHTSALLAKLARVRAARGDDDLADHLAREARERFAWCPMSYWPELDAWLTDRLARPRPAADV